MLRFEHAQSSAHYAEAATAARIPAGNATHTNAHENQPRNSSTRTCAPAGATGHSARCGGVQDGGEEPP